jgi:uncharacterized protein (DUF1501 family)
MNNRHNRRKFLKLAGLASLGLSTPVISAFNLKAMQAAANDNSSSKDDYKALVCFFMSGGNDSFNMLVPKGDAEYNEYSVTRSDMALPQGELHALQALNGNGKTFGLHPSLNGTANLFNNGHLAFVTNTGTLVEPTTKQQYQNNSVRLPLGLFSHSDQQHHWQTANPGERTTVGWGGKVADLIHDVNSNPIISMNISLSGTNIFQYGETLAEFSINPTSGASNINGYNNNWGINKERRKAIDKFFEREYDDIYEQTYINILKSGQQGSSQFQEAIEAVPDFNTVFEEDKVSQSFKMIAKTIAARQALGFKRQIFFIRYNGWDHHNDLLALQEEMFKTVDKGFMSFAEVLNELDVFDKVTTFTMSDFSRTLTSNGNGTDHAWGGNAMVMGGSVDGQKLYGQYPSLELGNPVELGKGVLLPTTANDLYFAELALWFGVNKSELPTIFPNISNFYDISSTEKPLGFLNF